MKSPDRFRPARLVAATLLAVHVGLLLGGLGHSFNMVDEVGNVVASLSDWKTGQFLVYLEQVDAACREMGLPSMTRPSADASSDTGQGRPLSKPICKPIGLTVVSGMIVRLVPTPCFGEISCVSSFSRA
jgi:hypothetical protein